MENSTLQITSNSEFHNKNVVVDNRGFLGVAQAGTSTNIDFKLLDDCFIIGAVLLVQNGSNGSAWGDCLDFQVVDIDNILGYGSNTVLGQFVTNWYVSTDSQIQFNEESSYPGKLTAGLYLRLIYNSVGTNDVNLAVNYRIHKALY